jgi:cysteine desulfurase/selenocysteine lyase
MPIATETLADEVRADFPILHERIHGKPLVWLDNASTTQKPRAVIHRLRQFYERENSNVHRCGHGLAAVATNAYEQARERIRAFLNARSAREIIFVRGATEGINLVAQSWGRRHIGPGDEILLSHLEHHANIVPWQHLADEAGAALRVIPVDDTGQIDLEAYAKLLGPRVKLVAFTHVSNALGTVTPAKQMIAMAHAVGAKALLDGAQSVSHMAVNLQSLNPDWFVFSGHKIFGPTGIGVLYGREEVLDVMEPWQRGGSMIREVTFERTTYNPAPHRFEAGTGNIAGAVGLSAAIDYVESIGLGRIADYESRLLQYATEQLTRIPGLRLIGTAREKAGVLAFIREGYSPDETGAALSREGIAVRAGHLLQRFGVKSTVRASLAFYNTFQEIDRLADTLNG